MTNSIAEVPEGSFISTGLPSMISFLCIHKECELKLRTLFSGKQTGENQRVNNFCCVKIEQILRTVLVLPAQLTFLSKRHPHKTDDHDLFDYDHDRQFYEGVTEFKPSQAPVSSVNVSQSLLGY